MSAVNGQDVQEQTQWVYPLSEALTRLRQEYLAGKIKAPTSRTSNWASSLGHPCELHLTFWRVSGEAARPVDTTLQQIFEEGRSHEDLILRELEAMGIRVLERGVPIASSDALFRSLNIRGAIDAKLDCSAIAYVLDEVAPGVDWSRKRVVAECKSLSPHFFDALVDYDALMTHKRHYVRAWAEQMQLYLLAHNDEAGLFVFKNKITGQLRFVPVTLDLDTCEALAQKAKRINASVDRHRLDGTFPEPIPWRQDVCAECPFLAVCPNSRQIPATEISTDEELIGLLERREQLKGMTSEAEEVKHRIDEKLEPLEGTDVLVGDYQVRWAKIERPERVTPAGTYFTKRITKLPGSSGTPHCLP